MTQRLNEGASMMASMECLWRSRSLFFATEVEILECLVALTLLYRSQTLVLDILEGRRGEVFDKKCLQRPLELNGTEECVRTSGPKYSEAALMHEEYV